MNALFDAYADLSLAKIRAVTAFNASCAELVLGLFEAEHPQDARPRDAVDVAWAFASGQPRSRRQSTTAVSTHRAAAAMAAGDAAAPGCLHPLARATQVGHILRGPSHAALAAGYLHTVGAGDNTNGQCDVGGRYNTMAVAAGATHTLSLCGDGLILATESNAFQQCETGPWRRPTV